MPKSKPVCSSDSDSSHSDVEPLPKKSKQAKKGKVEAKCSDTSRGDNGEIMYPLSKQRNVSVSEFRGKALVNIREYYEKDGKTLPGKKGISLSVDQWKKLKSYISDIDEQLEKM